MRTIEGIAYFGILKSSINSEKPVVTVCGAPFSGAAFDSYIWHRVRVKLPVQPAVRDSGLVEPTELVSDDQGDHAGRQSSETDG